MLKNFLLISLCSVVFSSTSAFSMHAPDTDNDRGGSTTFECKFGRVERAGVAIVKDYGPATATPALRFAVLVGADATRTKTINGAVLPYVNFFGGGCEINDKHSTVTAVEELYEETGKAINLHCSVLRYGNNSNYYGYAYSGDFEDTNTQGKNYNQLFFYRKDDASIRVIEKHMAACAKIEALSHRFKETNKAFAIPLQDLLDRARNLAFLEENEQYTQVKDDSNYIFQTRGDGDGTNRKDVYLDPQYMRNLGRDITGTSNYLPTICTNISGGLVN